MNEKYKNLVGQPEGNVPQWRRMRRHLRLHSVRFRTKSILLKADQQLTRVNTAVSRRAPLDVLRFFKNQRI
jgi:hypothetical protein